MRLLNWVFGQFRCTELTGCLDFRIRDDGPRWVVWGELGQRLLKGKIRGMDSPVSFCNVVMKGKVLRKIAQHPLTSIAVVA